MTTETITPARKRLNYGAGCATKILVAEALGMKPQYVDLARRLLKGEKVTPTDGAVLDKEASRIHEEMRTDAEKVAKANEIGGKILEEYGYAWNCKAASQASCRLRPVGRSGPPWR